MQCDSMNNVQYTCTVFKAIYLSYQSVCLDMNLAPMGNPFHFHLAKLCRLFNLIAKSQLVLENSGIHMQHFDFLKHLVHVHKKKKKSNFYLDFVIICDIPSLSI